MIYAIQAGEDGPIKFGVAGNPRSRLGNLQIGNPMPLAILAAVDLPNSCERQIHKWLREENVRGEWFRGPKTSDVLLDLKLRAKCKNKLEPGEEYGFWLALDGCRGSCAQEAS